MKHKEVIKTCDRCDKCSFRQKLWGFVCNNCNRFFDNAIYILDQEEEY